jgi:hypothetical protein
MGYFDGKMKDAVSEVEKRKNLYEKGIRDFWD